MEGFVERIKQHPGQVQVTRKAQGRRAGQAFSWTRTRGTRLPDLKGLEDTSLRTRVVTSGPR